MEEFLVELRKLVEKHIKKIEEALLIDVLSILYFQDYNKQCNYDKMSGSEVVDLQHKVLKEIEERYAVKLSDLLF